MKLRDYQIEIAEKATEKLSKYGVVYLSMEVRTGKTLTALEICKKNEYKNVLFLTKKKAINSIIEDYTAFGYSNFFKLTVINDESMHLIKETGFDIVIHDEHHRFGAFPKPNKSAKIFKEKYGLLPMIFLSGTPHPESFSQIYHQFWVKKGFWEKECMNFYKWFNYYGIKNQKNLGYAVVNDYTQLNPAGQSLISKIRDYLVISFTQEASGFKTKIDKKILYCNMKDQTKSLIRKLLKDKVATVNNEEIIADTAVKLQNKIHQICSGSVITEDGNYLIIDDSKAWFIKDHFEEKKLAIFYFFKSEYEILKTVFKDKLTNDLEEFNSTDKHIALQQVSGAEGISLKNADVLIFYNFGFSNVKFTQAIDRLTTIDRTYNDVYFILSRGGIEARILKTIDNKKNYILSAFKKDYGI